MFKKKILPIIIFFTLLIGMSYFPYIPMKLFNINYDNFNMTMKALYMFFCDLGYMLVLFLLYKDKIIKDFKSYFKNFGKNFEVSFKYYFIGVLIMIISNLILTIFVSGATANNEEAVRAMIDQAPLYMLFSVSIYAPFVEELIFRHSIKDSVICYGKNKITKYIYIIISGFIFGFLHMSLETTNYLDYLYIVPYMSLGVSFAALYHKTDNIFSSIMMHALHNTVTVILYFLASGVM
ncbi:MAG: CPBP family intramembrane metalloprotease [Bacilli bacterium]|nr:CPBP family intramembrane metalloprotease [Bacilli bacterium]